MSWRIAKAGLSFAGVAFLAACSSLSESCAEQRESVLPVLRSAAEGLEELLGAGESWCDDTSDGPIVLGWVDVPGAERGAVELAILASGGEGPISEDGSLFYSLPAGEVDEIVTVAIEEYFDGTFDVDVYSQSL